MKNKDDVDAEATKALDDVVAVRLVLSCHCGDLPNESPLSPKEVRDLRGALDNAIAALRRILEASS